MSVVTGVFAGALTAGVLLLLCSPLLYRGLIHRRRYHRFQDLPIETPATATPGKTALVTGTAHETDTGTIHAPVAGDPALLAAWDVHSLRRFHPVGVRYVWAPEALGIDTHGFEIHDDGYRLAVPDWSRQDRIEGRERLQLTGTGQMPVEGLDVDGLWVELETFDTETRVLPGEVVPDHLQQLGSRVGFPANRPTRVLPTLPWLRTPEATLQYREWSIEAGHEITIVGTAHEARTPDGSRRIVEPDEYPPLVSPLGPETLLHRYRWSYWRSVYGLVLVVLLVASVVGIGVAL